MPEVVEFGWADLTWCIFFAKEIDVDNIRSDYVFPFPKSITAKRILERHGIQTSSSFVKIW